jgi:catechol 2,3-dioxygenase-like lactoylglutathione lyase family enzyme
MNKPSDYITGLHHLTVSVGGAQEDIDFVTQVLGMRMIKQTVLLDGAASIYHLYYANANAEVGSVYTTFPFKQAGVYGRKGTGQIELNGLSVSTSSLDFWAKHLTDHGIKHSGIITRFGDSLVEFEDPAGIGIAVIGYDNDPREAWETDKISKAHGIRGIYSVTIRARDIIEMNSYLCDVLGFTNAGEENGYHRYYIKNGGYARIVEIHHLPDMAQGSWTFGVGIPHHIAFATANDAQNIELKAYIEGFGYTDVTELKDRNYFHSIYNRTPSGVLFEFATSDIGFAVDEPFDSLGHQLLLPPVFEHRRQEIIAPLEPIKVPDYISK